MSREQRIELIRIIAAAVLTAAAWLLPINGIWRLIAFLVPYLIAGYDVLWGAVRNILHGEVFDEEFLMTIATAGALAIGEYPEAVGVMIFYKTGELFEDMAVDKSRRSISALMDIRPEYAVALRNGAEVRLAPQEVGIGEEIIVAPGERIPLDGEIISGGTAVNAAALTGESLPVDKVEGDGVVSGSINLTGVIHIRTSSAYENSTVARILELVENAADKKAKAENFITRFSRVYTPVVVAGAVLLALIPPLLFHADWSEWINRALIFLMVSCPCALAVSVPVTFFAGIGGASRAGILIKGSNYMETLARVDAVAFDKTGTLTKGSFSVSAIHPSSLSEAELLDIAAAAESHSSHPVAESIVAAHGAHIDPSRVGEVTERAGLGIVADIDGARYYVGNGRLMAEADADWHECHLPGTVVHIAKEGEYLGHIVINDELKPTAKKAVTELKRLGVKRTVMLTGDSARAAEAVRLAAGVDDMRAGLLPGDKVKEVETLLSEGYTLAFVGDGINDAPVLARADVGIAMGALGSDAAIEAADVVLMDDDPVKLPAALGIARKTLGIVKENIIFALSVKAAILILSAMGIADMWIAVFGDVGVLMLAVLNALRAMRK